MNSTEMPRKIEVDMRGQVCPSSLLIALEQANIHKDALRTREVILEIKTDNRDAIVTIPDTVKNMGYESSVIKMAGYYKISIGLNLDKTGA